jgi:predicted nucleic acid-binding protein
MEYLDTNILIRFLTGDEPEQARAAAALLERIEKKELTVYAPDTVIADAVFVLSSPRLYRKTREEIRVLLFPLLSLEAFKVDHRKELLRALEIYATFPIDFSDAFLKATMEAAGATILYSYDTDFDRFPDITRKEPDKSDQQAA